MAIYQYHYVYRITNIILNKHYYGKRSTNTLPKLDIGIKYFSSSTDNVFIKDQNDNPQNYIYKVIYIFDNIVSATNLEIKLHNKFDVGINESFYNRAKQTSIGFDRCGLPGFCANKGEQLPQKSIDNIRAGKLKPKNRKHNCWLQINRFYPDFPFGTYEEFEIAVLKCYGNGCEQPATIARKLKIKGIKSVHTVLKINNIDVTKDVVSVLFERYYSDKWKNIFDLTDKIIELHNKKYTPYYIAKLIDAKTCMVVGILKRNNIEPNVGDPYWNRLINRMPDFPFDDYQSLVDFCKEEYSRGVKIYKISKQLRISEDMVNTAVFLK